MMKVTMSDIAREARTSVATVGRVIHNNGYVSGDVRERIERAIQALGYVPNQSARILKSARSGVIGCLVVESMNGLYYRINDSVIRSARERGYTCVTMEAQKRSGSEAELLRGMIGMRVDGIVIISNTRITPDMFGLLRRFETPVVAIERGYPEQGIDSLLVQDREAVGDAVRRIAAKGHRRIALIAREVVHAVEARRLQGYLDALADSGLPADDSLIRLAEHYTASDGRAAMETLLSLPEPPTAVMATADTLAAGALQSAYAQGLRVPEGLSVVGYDDVLSEYLSPQIDSVGLVLDDVGDATMDLLEKRREDMSRPAECRPILTRYVDRGTVRTLIE